MTVTDELVWRGRELQSEVCRLATQMETLADFLTANFENEIGLGAEQLSEAVVQVTLRLLGELKKRRELAAASAEIARLKEGGIEAPHPWVAT